MGTACCRQARSCSCSSSIAGLRGEEVGLSGDLYSVLEFVACVLTYLATAARAYVAANMACLLGVVLLRRAGDAVSRYRGMVGAVGLEPTTSTV